MASKKPSAKKKTPAPAKKAAAPRPKVTASDFIRSLPFSTPRAEVVAKAKAAGYGDINPKLVNKARKRASAAGLPGGKPKAPPAPAKRNGEARKGQNGATPPTAGDERAVLAAVANLGAARVRSLVDAAEKRIRDAVLKG